MRFSAVKYSNLLSMCLSTTFDNKSAHLQTKQKSDFKYAGFTTLNQVSNHQGIDSPIQTTWM